MNSASPLAYIATAFLSGVSSFLLFRYGATLFDRLGLLDNPGPYGHKRAPVPFWFGVLLYLNFLIVAWILVAFWIMQLSEKLIILMVLGWIVTGVSFIDDLDTIFKFDRVEKQKPLETQEELSRVRKTRFAISPKIRLTLQILIGLIVGLTSIKISYVSNIFGGILYLDFFSITLFGYEVFLIPLVFTIFWYVLVFNSVNWSDGVPGLTTWLGSITLIVIFILTIRFYLVDETPALRQNSVFVFSVLSILIPSLLLAWRYNLVPKMLLWDSGTMFIAFMIASLAILVGGKVATVATALWVYLVDAIYVIVARIINKKNPLKGDRIHHLHYRLKAIGMSDGFIRNFVYSVALFFGISAVFLDKTGKIILFIALVFVIVFITKILTLKGNRQGFSLVELLVAVSLVGLISISGFKLYSDLERRGQESVLATRVESFLKNIDQQVRFGVISDYWARLDMGAGGILAWMNGYKDPNPVEIWFDWNGYSGALIYSGAKQPGYSISSENRVYSRLLIQTWAVRSELPFTLSGTFDAPQVIRTFDGSTPKQEFLLFPFDAGSGPGRRTAHIVSFSGAASYTGIIIANQRGVIRYSDSQGNAVETVGVAIEKGDLIFEQTLPLWK